MSSTTSNTDPTGDKPSTSPPQLAFGVELEMLVRPRQNLQGTAFRDSLERNGWFDYVLSDTRAQPGYCPAQASQNKTALRIAIAEALTRDGVPASTRVNLSTYQIWTVCDERLPVPPTYWGIELVSPVLSTANDWQAEIDSVFDILTKYCDIKTSFSCGMHVHVSPGWGMRFNDDQLRNICTGLSYHEMPAAAVLPGNRKENSYCQSNIRTDAYIYDPDYKILPAFEAIPTQSWAPVLRILEEVNNTTIGDILHGGNKNSAWNFSRLAMGKTSSSATIEYRLPPGVESSKEAKHWASFVLGMFAESMATDWIEEGKQRLENRFDHPSVEELERFISSGLQRLGSTCQNALVKDWIKEDNSKAMTEEEMNDLIQQWEAENDKLKEEWWSKNLIGPDAVVPWTPYIQEEEDVPHYSDWDLESTDSLFNSGCMCSIDGGEKSCTCTNDDGESEQDEGHAGACAMDEEERRTWGSCMADSPKSSEWLTTHRLSFSGSSWN